MHSFRIVKCHKIISSLYLLTFNQLWTITGMSNPFCIICKKRETSISSKRKKKKNINRIRCSVRRCKIKHIRDRREAQMQKSAKKMRREIWLKMTLRWMRRKSNPLTAMNSWTRIQLRNSHRARGSTCKNKSMQDFQWD